MFIRARASDSLTNRLFDFCLRLLGDVAAHGRGQREEVTLWDHVSFL